MRKSAYAISLSILVAALPSLAQVARPPVPLGGAGDPNAGGAKPPANPVVGGQGGTGTGGTGGQPGTGTGTGTGTGGAKPPVNPPTIGPGGKAQGDTAGLQQFEQGMEYEPRNPNYKVSFSLEEADLPELVRVIGQLTGKRFIFSGKVRNIKATIYSPQKITVGEAYQAFLSILETNGLTVVPHGRFLKIVDTQGIATQNTPTYGAGQAAPQEDRFVTRIHRLQHSGADEIANVLGHFKSKDGDITIQPGGNLLIITDTGANIRRMMQIIEEIDVGATGDQMWIEGLHYASASDVASRINEIFDLKGGGGGGGGTKGAAGAPSTGGAGGGDLHVTKVVADDRSNSVIIVATERAYLRILEFIKRIDVPQTGEGEIHVLPLQHADAIELTKTLNEIVGGGTAAGAGGAPGAPRAGGGAPIAQQVFEGGIKISADKATNSIVVTSSLRDYASLRAVVDKLDQARRQVFIEAVIMDLSINRATTLGVQFHAGGASDLGLGPAGQTILYGGLNPASTILPLSQAAAADPTLFQGLALGARGPGVPGTSQLLGTGQDIPAFGIILSALATAGDADVLSTPHILCTDNIPAEISVGENVPLQQNLGGLPGGSGATTGGVTPGSFGLIGASPQRQDVGTKLKITPHMNESNEVRLELNEEISEAREPQGTLGVVPITKRTANTQLIVKDQQTVVIGGLMRNRIVHTESKIPVLGDIPLLGILFRKQTDAFQKSNLVLVLTPYIIREQGDLRTIYERKMQERQEFLDRYFVFSDVPGYEPPKDYARTNGLLEDIKRTYRDMDEQARLDELTRPKELKTHMPGDPLDLPQGGQRGGAPNTNASPTGTPAPPPNVNVVPAPRSLDKQEK